MDLVYGQTYLNNEFPNLIFWNLLIFILGFILQDPDGYEICFVGKLGFFELCIPTYDKI